MAKVFGLHQAITLRDGTKSAEFERFATKEVCPIFAAFQGWKTHLLKGIKGDRKGEYLLMFEIESVEALTRYVPLEGEHSEAAKQLMASHAALFAQWQTFASGPLDPRFTDYVVVDKEE